MAQERNVEYNVPVVSFQVNQMKQGIIPKGRYRGFNSITNPGGALSILLIIQNLMAKQKQGKQLLVLYHQILIEPDLIQLPGRNIVIVIRSSNNTA